MTSSKEYDAKRSAEKPWRRWYFTKAWSKIRFRRLHNEPICRMCKEAGFINDGSWTPDRVYIKDPSKRKLIVDHIKPHRGDPSKFYDYDGTQSLCIEHHNSAKQAIEKSCAEPRDIYGWPV